MPRPPGLLPEPAAPSLPPWATSWVAEVITVPSSPQAARDWKGPGSLVPRFLLCGMRSHSLHRAIGTGCLSPGLAPCWAHGLGLGKAMTTLKKNAPRESSVLLGAI